MQILNHDQRSTEWYEARLGKPSASQFGRIITPTGKQSSQVEGYINELIHERITGERQETISSEWMQRGIEMEPDAILWYEIVKGIKVNQVGFCLHDTMAVGASPDGLIGDDGGLEIKCPAPLNHIGYVRDSRIPTKYIPQVQGCMWITERKWWDFLSYHPDYPKMLVRVHRDETFISKLEQEVAKMITLVDNGVKSLKENSDE